MSHSNLATKVKTFNLHTVGVGYINRLRQVEVKKSKYFAISIGALYGVANEDGRAESSLYDLKAVTERGIFAVEELLPLFNSGKKIFLEFKAGDTRAEVFEYKKGPKAGTHGACIKGTLLEVRRAWVDGEIIIDLTDAKAQERSIDETTNQVSEAAEPESIDAWRLRLESAKPQRLVILKDDPLVDEKVECVIHSCMYENVAASRSDAYCFRLI